MKLQYALFALLIVVVCCDSPSWAQLMPYPYPTSLLIRDQRQVARGQGLYENNPFDVPPTPHTPQIRYDVPNPSRVICNPDPTDNVIRCKGKTPKITRKYGLWLEPGSSKPLKIEIPNYELDDWIEAGFLERLYNRSLIEVKLLPPTGVGHARAQATPSTDSDVYVNYEKVEPREQHFKQGTIEIVPKHVLWNPDKPRPQRPQAQPQPPRYQQFKRELPPYYQAQAWPQYRQFKREVSDPQYQYQYPPKGNWYPISQPNGRRI